MNPHHRIMLHRRNIIHTDDLTRDLTPDSVCSASHRVLNGRVITGDCSEGTCTFRFNLSHSTILGGLGGNFHHCHLIRAGFLHHRSLSLNLSNKLGYHIECGFLNHVAVRLQTFQYLTSAKRGVPRDLSVWANDAHHKVNIALYLVTFGDSTQLNRTLLPSTLRSSTR